MNVQLLRRVQQHILDHPESFQMEYWKTLCGTACCIAGHALDIGGAEWMPDYYGHGMVIRTVSPDRRLATMQAATNLLEIDMKQANELFVSTEWPHPFVRDWDDAETRRDRARVASARIDAFIEQYCPTDETLPETKYEQTESADHLA